MTIEEGQGYIAMEFPSPMTSIHNEACVCVMLSKLLQLTVTVFEINSSMKNKATLVIILPTYEHEHIQRFGMHKQHMTK